MSSSNCCFLTCKQISQEAGQVVWESHFVKDFLQFAAMHTVEGSGTLREAEVGVFVAPPCFYNDPADAGSAPMGLTNQQ